MRIIVTGAAGFIGSVFTKRATELGHEVIAIDNLSRGLNEPWMVPGAHFLQHDCIGGVGEAVAQLGLYDTVDAVVHFAAGTGSLDRPIEELRGLNVEMTKRVYDDARALGAKVFCFPTTSLALGVPDSPYVKSKEEGFEWLKAQTHDDITRIPFRFFNVAGAYKGFTERRQKEVHLIPRLAECLLKSETLVINGNDYSTRDGTPSRDFINVVDVVEYILFNIIRAMNGTSAPVEDDGAVWLATGYTITSLEVLKVVEQFFTPVKYEIGPRRAFDVGGLYARKEVPECVRWALNRSLVPAWISIRDEVAALLKHAR